MSYILIALKELQNNKALWDAVPAQIEYGDDVPDPFLTDDEKKEEEEESEGEQTPIQGELAIEMTQKNDIHEDLKATTDELTTVLAMQEHKERPS